MSKKLALFDMDGTLFDTEVVNFNAYKAAIEEQGLKFEYDYFINNCVGRQYKDFIYPVLGDRTDLFDIIHKRKKELYSRFLDKARVNEHLINIAKNIKEEYNLVIVTTASKKNTYDILEHFNLFDLFDLILTSEDVKKNKPDPEGYLKAIDYYKSNIDDVIIFEDSPVGVEAAKKTGATVFVINNF